MGAVYVNIWYCCWELRGAEHILTVLELYLLMLKPEVGIVKATAVDFSGISNCFNAVVELGFFFCPFYYGILK